MNYAWTNERQVHGRMNDELKILISFLSIILAMQYLKNLFPKKTSSRIPLDYNLLIQLCVVQVDEEQPKTDHVLF